MEKAAVEGPDEGMHGRDAAMEAKKAFDKGSPDDLGNTDARGDIPLLDNLLPDGMLGVGVMAGLWAQLAGACLPACC